ncbi:MAG: hypothetical protein K9G62_06720 [Alphaproteobacteria bacterium]|nr:hypothetical protein [Alphaproteobacteria bacterium]
MSNRFFDVTKELWDTIQEPFTSAANNGGASVVSAKPPSLDSVHLDQNSPTVSVVISGQLNGEQKNLIDGRVIRGCVTDVKFSNNILERNLYTINFLNNVPWSLK